MILRLATFPIIYIYIYSPHQENKTTNAFRGNQYFKIDNRKDTSKVDKEEIREKRGITDVMKFVKKTRREGNGEKMMIG